MNSKKLSIGIIKNLAKIFGVNVVIEEKDSKIQVLAETVIDIDKFENISKTAVDTFSSLLKGKNSSCKEASDENPNCCKKPTKKSKKRLTKDFIKTRKGFKVNKKKKLSKDEIREVVILKLNNPDIESKHLATKYKCSVGTIAAIFANIGRPGNYYTTIIKQGD